MQRLIAAFIISQLSCALFAAADAYERFSHLPKDISVEITSGVFDPPSPLRTTNVWLKFENPDDYSTENGDFLKAKLLPKIELNGEVVSLKSAKNAEKVRSSATKGVRTSFRVLWKISQEERFIPPEGGKHSYKFYFETPWGNWKTEEVAIEVDFSPADEEAYQHLAEQGGLPFFREFEIIRHREDERERPLYYDLEAVIGVLSQYPETDTARLIRRKAYVSCSNHISRSRPVNSNDIEATATILQLTGGIDLNKLVDRNIEYWKKKGTEEDLERIQKTRQLVSMWDYELDRARGRLASQAVGKLIDRPDGQQE